MKDIRSVGVLSAFMMEVMISVGSLVKVGGLRYEPVVVDIIIKTRAAAMVLLKLIGVA